MCCGANGGKHGVENYSIYRELQLCRWVRDDSIFSAGKSNQNKEQRQRYCEMFHFILLKTSKNSSGDFLISSISVFLLYFRSIFDPI